MTLPRPYWHEMQAPDFLGGEKDWIAVLPVCAIEQHGPHLPVYTDHCIGEGMVKRTVELLPEGLPGLIAAVEALGGRVTHQQEGSLLLEVDQFLDRDVACRRAVQQRGCGQRFGALHGRVVVLCRSWRRGSRRGGLGSGRRRRPRRFRFPPNCPVPMPGPRTPGVHNWHGGHRTALLGDGEGVGYGVNDFRS